MTQRLDKMKPPHARRRIGIRTALAVTITHNVNPHNMDLRTFNRLPLDEKTNYMWDHGNCISQRLVENRYILCIFEINGFYVEAIYSKQNNRVNAILPIMGMDSWEAYVDRIIRNVTEMN